MAERKVFTYMQVALAGLVGSPLAAAALVSWNLSGRGKLIASGFLFVFLGVLVVSDVTVRAVGSVLLGTLLFLILLLTAMLINYLVIHEEEQSAQSWNRVVPVVLGSLVICGLYRYWVL